LEVIMFKHWVCLGTGAALSLSVLAIAPSPAQTVPAPTVNATAAEALPALNDTRTTGRGELLYTTHCIACHTTEVHWRNKRAASSWPTLKAQVRRWQDVASLAWGDSDILEVSRYLNETIYHFEQTVDPVSSSGPRLHEPVSMVSRLVPVQRP
jgi:mono/diheme cytochrome c family protein